MRGEYINRVKHKEATNQSLNQDVPMCLHRGIRFLAREKEKAGKGN